MSTLIRKQPVLHAYVPNTDSKSKTDKNKLSLDPGKHLALRSKVLVTQVTFVLSICSTPHHTSINSTEAGILHLTLKTVKHQRISYVLLLSPENEENHGSDKKPSFE